MAQQDREDIDQLYDGALDRFTADRNALAKRLRADGDRAAADQVSKLRKPTVAAWLVNRLAHRHRDDLDQFLAAADELRRAQDEALRGEGGEHLRQATKAEHEAVNRLVGIARSEHTTAEAILDRVRQTLEAAITDPDARRLLEAGRVERELRPGAVPSPPETPGKLKEDPRSRKQAEIAAAQHALDELSDQLERAERLEAERQEQKADAGTRLSEARKELASARKATRQLRGKVNTA